MYHHHRDSLRITRHWFWLVGDVAVRQGVGKVDGGEGFLAMLLNLIWLFFFGWELALAHVILGIIFFVTIIGIPFGRKHFQLVPVSLLPFSYTLTPIEK